MTFPGTADWTDEKVELLKRLWADGFSASEIAAKRGLTRNQVLGKLKRLGLLGRANNPKPGPKKLAESSPLPAPRPVRQPDTVFGAVNTIKAWCVPAPPLSPQEPAESVIPLAHRCTLFDLTDSTCKWPINDPPRGGEHLFCGAKTIEGLPYCKYHSARAYQPAGKVNMWKAG